MRRTDRLFEIIQILRTARKPCRAEELAERLEVSKRTVYRDIAVLQGLRTPIDGQAGVGYIMRPGYDLPPVRFDVEEAEAVSLGLRMIARTGDTALVKAAQRAALRLHEAAPDAEALLTSIWGAKAPPHADLAAIRNAIREEQKLNLRYRADSGDTTQRLVWPLAVIYYVSAVVLVAWCELRRDFRQFRVDRMQECLLSSEGFVGQGESRRKEWEARYKTTVLQPE